MKPRGYDDKKLDRERQILDGFTLYKSKTSITKNININSYKFCIVLLTLRKNKKHSVFQKNGWWGAQKGRHS